MGDHNYQWWIGGIGDDGMIESFGSREEAVVAGKDLFHGNFRLVHADKDLPSYPSGEDMLHVFYDINEDLAQEGDPFGDDMEVTREQEDELTGLLNNVFVGWLQRHKLSPYVFKFGDTLSDEEIRAEAA